MHLGIRIYDGNCLSYFSHPFFKSSRSSMFHGIFLSQISREINLAVNNKGDATPMGSYILAMVRNTICFVAVNYFSGNVNDRSSFALFYPTPRHFVSDAFVPRLSFAKVDSSLSAFLHPYPFQWSAICVVQTLQL